MEREYMTFIVCGIDRRLKNGAFSKGMSGTPFSNILETLFTYLNPDSIFYISG